MKIIYWLILYINYLMHKFCKREKSNLKNQKKNKRKEKKSKKKEKNYDDKCVIIFEGEYSGGKRNGKGKEYNDNGDLIFEGEYLDGKIWNGKFKGYNFTNNINKKFDGEYLNGKIKNGVMYDNNGIIYEIMNGSGILKQYNYEDKLVFEGEYLNGIKNGMEK